MTLQAQPADRREKWIMLTRLDFQCAACQSVGVEQRFELVMGGGEINVVVVEVECLACRALVKYDPGELEVVPVP